MNPFAVLADPSRALAAHAAMPAGRVVEKLNAAAEDAILAAEKAEARRQYEAEYNARLAAIRLAAKRERRRRASQAYRDRRARATSRRVGRQAQA